MCRNKVISNYELNSFLFSSVSLCFTLIFFVCNLATGIFYRSVWNFSISFYYLLLAFLRGLVIFSEKRWQYIENIARNRNRIHLFRLISKFLILLDFASIIPISLMILSRRTVVMGKIPAIATATYTAYKITVSAVNYKKAKNREILSLFCLKIINLKDAMVSVLTLQNTLISVFDSGKSMLTLTSCTSAAQLTAMIIMTFFWIKKGKSIG